MLHVETHGEQRCLINSSGVCLVPLRAFSELANSLPGSAFVLASGPSVKTFPLQSYGSYPCIAMNGSILAAVECGITPYFYLCDDEGFARDKSELALLGLASSSHVAMSYEVLCRLHEADPDSLRGRSIFLLERVNRFLGKPSLPDRTYARSIRKDSDLVSSFSWIRRAPNRIGFSLNLDKGYFVARTIPYVALQLCYQLGSRQVFLVGFDLTPGSGRFYEEGEGRLRTSLNEDYDKYILPSFSLMAKRVVSPTRFEVFNLSANSRMPETVIPKVELAGIGALLSAP